MSYRCENCQSLFFKTLETRIHVENAAILYKKRCKRCKYKYLVRKAVSNLKIQPATHEEWTMSLKVTLPQAATASARGKIFVSEYTNRVSRPADEQILYLNQIQAAEEGQTNGQSQTAR